MKASFFGLWALVPIALAATPTRRQEEKKEAVPAPSQIPKIGEFRSQGCWTKKGDWKKYTKDLPFDVSSGNCNILCKSIGNWVSALQGNDCYCGKTYPPEGSITKDSECNYPCPGYDLEACGSIGSKLRYSVFNTGVELNVDFAGDSSDDSEDDDADDDKPKTTATTPTPTSATLAPTVGVTKAPSDDESSGGGSNSVGIAVGVVVGIVVLALVCLGVFFYMRRKKAREEDEERRRADTINSFVGGKSGSISGGTSITDSRLDPSVANRRFSDGSIADNHDYSRKILRVTNA